MTNELIHQSVFEKLKHVDENGNEYWSARDMARILEYSEYRHFLGVIEKAKEACGNSGFRIEDHFEDMLGMIIIGKGGQRQVEDVKLSRYACYLIVQNADPTKRSWLRAKPILLFRHVCRKSVRCRNSPVLLRKMKSVCSFAMK